MRRITVPVLLGAVVLAACPGGDGAPATPPPAMTAEGACDMVAARGSCVEYTGASEATIAELGTTCAAYGTFGTSCPAGGRVGTCLIPTPIYLVALGLYAPGWTAADGEFMCGDGAWIVPGAPEELASPATVSCADRWTASCSDTSGLMTPTLRTALERRCTAGEYDLLEGACPTADRIGTCTTRPGELVWDTRYYRPAVPEAARPICLDRDGSWTDG